MTALVRWADENPGKLLITAPLFFAAHILEELPGFLGPGYVSWFNSVASPPLVEEGFLAANLTPFLITAVLAAVAAYTWWRPVMLLLLAWTSYFFLANAIFHVVATLVMLRYSPGVVTAILFYLPFFFWFLRFLRIRIGVGPPALAIVTMIAGMPMFVQGYLIVFQRTRFH